MPVISIIERIERIKFDAISDARLDHADGNEYRYKERCSEIKHTKLYSKAYWTEIKRLTREVVNG